MQRTYTQGLEVVLQFTGGSIVGLTQPTLKLMAVNSSETRNVRAVGCSG